MREALALWGGDQVAVRPSAIHGVGVFALRDFAAGELILIRDERREVTPAAPLREDLGEFEWHCDWLEGGRQVLLPAPERHINHSCEPNSYLRWADGESRNLALRPIVTGEEITHSYSINLAGGVAWDCNCGAARCLRRVPGSFFELPHDRQRTWMRLLADWFVAEHRDEYDALRK